MIKLFTCLALLALAAGAQAQINHPYNELGIYAVPDPDGCATAQIDVPPLTVFNCWVVLTSPWNEDLGRPVATVGGIEFRLVVPGDVYLLGVDYGMCIPPFTPTLPDFLVGCATPVVDGRATLLGLTLMAMLASPSFLYLSPVQDAPQTFPGQIAFSDYDDDWSLHVMYPVSGGFDVPVFAINWDGELSFCETVPDAGMAFGALKALYR